MKRKTWPLLATICSLSLLAAACSNDDTSTTDAADSDAVAVTSDGDGESEDMPDDGMEDMEDDAMEGDMEDMADGGHGHDGAVIDVPEGMAVPAVAVTAEADSVSGHNLFVELTDFTLAPENASTDPVDGEGHLHLYVDGERTTRFYNEAVHVTGLAPGEHELMVEVSANNHSAYAVDGAPIRAMTTITVDDEAAGHGGHDDTALFEPESAPTATVTATKDPLSGWNLFVDVTDFEFTPETVGGTAAEGQGHLHLLVNDEKATRLYGSWWHLASLPAGANEIAVEVVADDHAVFGVDGEPIVASTTIEVTEEEAAANDGHDNGDNGDNHGDDESHDADGDAEESHGADSDTEEGHGDHGGGEMADIDPADADVVVEATVTAEGVDVESRRIDVSTGQTVGVIVEAEESELVHVHGYDLLDEVGDGQPAEIAFLADSPGVFEVELENSGRFLFEFEVSDS